MARPRQSRDNGIAVAYVRVSTEEQRLGIQAQATAIEAWAAKERVQVAFYAIDHGVSGTTPLEERKGLSEAIRAAQLMGAGRIVVAKRDRLGRDVYITATIEYVAKRKRLTIASADGVGNGNNPAELFMKGVIDATAEFERNMISERTRRALLEKKKRGEACGCTPWGYRREGDRITPDLGEQWAAELARSLRAKGLSVQAISNRLASLGALNRNGKPIGLATLRAILTLI